MATIAELRELTDNQEAYFTDSTGRVVAICHKPETMNDEEKRRATMLPDTVRLAPPKCKPTEQLAMFIVDGHLEWRVEARQLSSEEAAQARIDARLERIEAKLDALTGASTDGK